MSNPLYKLIAVSNTGSAITLEQLAVTVPSGSQVSLTDFNFIDEIHQDEQLIQEVISGNLFISASLSTIDGTPDNTALYDSTGSINLLRFLVSPQDTAEAVTGAVSFTSGTVADAGKLVKLDSNGLLNIAAALSGNIIVDTHFSGVTPGFMLKTGDSSYEVIKTELSGIVAPGTGEDGGDGFKVGSRWIDVSAQEEYILFDAATGSAVWVKTSAEDHGELTGLEDNDHPQYYHVSGTNAIAADVDLTNTFKIVNMPTPTSATDGANKSYVDAAAVGLDWKASVEFYASASVDGLTGAATVDSVALTTGDRIVLNNQQEITALSASENGLYVVSTTGSWFRALDADEDAEVTAGLAVFVTSGSTWTDTGWVLATDDPITVGTTGQNFVQFNGLEGVTAGAGLTKTGNTLDVGANGDGSITVNIDDIQVGVLATDAQHGVRGGGTQHAVATTTVNGFFSSSDKSKIDTLSTGSAYVRVDGTTPMSGNLDLATNNIINVGTLNGVTVETHGSRHISGAADPIDGDKLDVDFSPSIYVPSTVPAEVDTAEELSAHLAGIDNKLGAISASLTGTVVSEEPVVDNSLTRYDGTTGRLIQDSTVLVDDSGNVTVTGSLSVTGTINDLRHYPNSTTDPSTPAPAAGDRYYNTTLEEEMRYDGTRTKWLSVTSINVQCGRKGSTQNGGFYRTIDGLVMTPTTIGVPTPKGTITRITAIKTDVTSSVVEVLSGAAVVAHLSMSDNVAGPVLDDSINATLLTNGFISLRNKSGEQKSTNIQIVVTIKRQV